MFKKTTFAILAILILTVSAVPEDYFYNDMGSRADIDAYGENCSSSGGVQDATFYETNNSHSENISIISTSQRVKTWEFGNLLSGLGVSALAGGAVGAYACSAGIVADGPGLGGILACAGAGSIAGMAGYLLTGFATEPIQETAAIVKMEINGIPQNIEATDFYNYTYSDIYGGTSSFNCNADRVYELKTFKNVSNGDALELSINGLYSTFGKHTPESTNITEFGYVVFTGLDKQLFNRVEIMVFDETGAILNDVIPTVYGIEQVKVSGNTYWTSAQVFLTVSSEADANAINDGGRTIGIYLKAGIDETPNVADVRFISGGAGYSEQETIYGLGCGGSDLRQIYSDTIGANTNIYRIRKSVYGVAIITENIEVSKTGTMAGANYTVLKSQKISGACPAITTPAHTESIIMDWNNDFYMDNATIGEGLTGILIYSKNWEYDSALESDTLIIIDDSSALLMSGRATMPEITRADFMLMSKKILTNEAEGKINSVGDSLTGLYNITTGTAVYLANADNANVLAGINHTTRDYHNITETVFRTEVVNGAITNFSGTTVLILMVAVLLGAYYVFVKEGAGGQ